MKKVALHILIALLVLVVGFVMGVILGKVAETSAIRSLAPPSVALRQDRGGRADLTLILPPASRLVPLADCSGSGAAPG